MNVYTLATYPFLNEAKVVVRRENVRTEEILYDPIYQRARDIGRQRIADAMDTNGMREAGYNYIVLDDAWMATSRDAEGNLVADPAKFPSGMKALGDYLHSKGFKFGVYDDRRETILLRPGCGGFDLLFRHVSSWIGGLGRDHEELVFFADVFKRGIGFVDFGS